LVDVPAGLPPIDFGIHRLRANEAGGRHEFEQMVTSLVDQLHGPAHTVTPNPGDWGIDVYTGDLSSRVRIWQVKYFINGVGDGQLDAVGKSFARACQEADRRGYRIDGWALCIPVSLDGPRSQRFDTWRTRRTAETSIPIDLWDETRLRTLLMEPKCAGIRRVYYGRSQEDPAPAATTRLRIRPDTHAIDAAGAADVTSWRGGVELRIGEATYLLYEPIIECTGPDGSWVLRDASARELEPDPRAVRIRHMRIRRPSTDGAERLAAVRAQGDLLDKLRGAVGLPALLARHGAAEFAALVMSAPIGRPWREVHGESGFGADLGGPGRPPGPGGVPGPSGVPGSGQAGGPDRIAAAAVLADAARLCRTVGVLHRQGLAHRWLTPDEIVLPRPGKGGLEPVLRDLGLAGLPETPAAGPAGPAGPGPHLTPEQRQPGAGLLSPTSLRPGPATDVYQIAVLVLTAVGGRHPRDVPLPGIPDQLNELLARALAPDPASRPRVGELASGLWAARRRLSVGEPGEGRS